MALDILYSIRGNLDFPVRKKLKYVPCANTRDRKADAAGQFCINKKPQYPKRFMKPPLRQGSPDDFQTPPEALAPLLPYLKKEWTIWECAAGKRNLSNELSRLGFKCYATDIIDDEAFDFLGEYGIDFFDCIITNPPFKYKQQFLERCYELGKPFALLLPLTTFETGKRQKLFRKNGLEVIFMPKRINFETPNKIANSNSWFATAWFTNGLNIGRQLTFFNPS